MHVTHFICTYLVNRPSLKGRCAIGSQRTMSLFAKSVTEIALVPSAAHTGDELCSMGRYAIGSHCIMSVYIEAPSYTCSGCSIFQDVSPSYCLIEKLTLNKQSTTIADDATAALEICITQ